MLTNIISKFISPQNFYELWNEIDCNPNYNIIAGGTDILVKFKSSILSEPKVFINIKKINELQKIKEDENGVEIGSTLTMNEIIENNIINDRYPILIQAIKMIGSPQIRNMGTIGGNIANASPASDSVPALLVLDARVKLIKKSSERIIPLKDFSIGPGKTKLEKGEIIESIIIPRLNSQSRGYFIKVGTRKSLAISKVSLAMIGVSDQNKVSDVKIALGAVAPTVIRAFKTESFLEKKVVDEKIIEQAGNILMDESCPIDDFRSTAIYRKKIIKNLLKKAIEQIVNN